MKIKFIGHSYHISTGSSKFFIEILEKLGTVDTTWDEEWIKPEKRISLSDLEHYDLIVIWQVPHIARRIPEELKKKTVFVPMYDAVANIGAKFWRRLRGLRVICFSYTNFIECKNNGLQCFYIQYFPEAGSVAKSFDTLRLFFWQRQEAPNWRTIAGYLPIAQFDCIHLHAAVDPGAGNFVRPLECEFQKFNIRVTQWFDNKQEFLRELDKSNVFFAPRQNEGIGMAMLEAMQRGMVCVGLNAPTMNEYIVHGLNGYLVPVEADECVHITDGQQIAANAAAMLATGRQRFERQISDLYEFLTGEVLPKFRNVVSPALAKWREARVSKIVRHASKVPLATRPRAEAPRVSVITVVRNDAIGLARTVESVLGQTYSDFEYWVVDGASTDRTKRLLKQLPGDRVSVVSAPDGGPYDAMNQAAQRARGEFVIFINAGDLFFSTRTLEFAMLDCPEDADIVYGHHVYVSKDRHCLAKRAQFLERTYSILKKGKLSYSWLDGIPCHQATFVRRSRLLQSPYDWRRYPIAADHDFLFRVLQAGAVTHHTNTIVSYYHGGGMSAKNLTRCVADWKAIAMCYTDDPVRAAKFYGEGSF